MPAIIVNSVTSAFKTDTATNISFAKSIGRSSMLYSPMMIDQLTYPFVANDKVPGLRVLFIVIWTFMVLLLKVGIFIVRLLTRILSTHLCTFS